MSRKLPIGVTAAPFIRSGPAVALELARCADQLGYDSFWVAEVPGAEAFSVLGATAQVAPSIGLGTGVVCRTGAFWRQCNYLRQRPCGRRRS
jgi:alkanesulfonate monooxygenase SsuD/methylene tetrahydromethanopterin reductase-like flavin-dependent oxidoreductase (luciferase family)